MEHFSLKALPKDHDLLACPACDALYLRPAVVKSQQFLRCRQCQSKLIDGVTDFRPAFIFALSALLLFFIANLSPFLTLDLKGELTTVSVFSSVEALYDNGLRVLAVLVMVFIILMPLYHMLAILWVIVSFRQKWLRALTRRTLHWMYHIAPWNMLEVYFVGVLVTMVKIMAMAEVRFESGFWAYLALMACSIMAIVRFDVNDALFGAYDDE